jgi:hypothetical protein
MTRSATTTSGLQVALLAVTPPLLLAALVWHPYIGGRLPNNAAIADAVVAGTTRWGLVHLVSGVAFGFVVLAFIAVRGYLRATGEDRWSRFGLPFVVIGSTLYTMLPGMEFAALAAAESGGDAEAAQAALVSWIVPVLIIGGILFLTGTFGFVLGIARGGVLPPGLTSLVVGGLLVMAVSRLVPFSTVQFYVQGLSAFVAMWPLAYQMWKLPTPAATRPQPVPAT